MASKDKPVHREAKSPAVARWQELAAAELRGKPLADLDWRTSEGITVKPVYTEADLALLRALGVGQRPRRLKRPEETR